MRRIRSVVVCCSILVALQRVAFSQQSSALESLLASAKQAQARGNFEAAAEYYRQGITLQPEVAELRANLGLMYYQTGKDEQAIDAFLQAIRLKPSLFVPNLFLGLDYLKLKRFNEAIPYLKRASLSNPTDPEVHRTLGQAYAAGGKTRLAIASYRRAVELNSGNADDWFHLGVAYLEQIEADARILLSRHKGSGYLHALVGDTFAEQKAFIQAAEAYKAALASSAFPSGMHAAYGFVLLNQHDLAGAERELRAELVSNPGSLMAKLGFARLQFEQAQAKKAVNGIVGIWKADPSFLQTNASAFNRGLPDSKIAGLQSALEEGRTAGEVPEEVVAVFQTDAKGETIPELPQPSSIAVGSPGPTGRPSGTAAMYDGCSDVLAARLQQPQAKDLRLLASCAYSTGKYETVFGAAQKLALNPATEAEGLYWETKSAQKLATETLARASELDSNSPTLHVLLGDVYRQREFYPDAEQEYRKALAIQPDNSGAMFGLSLVLLGNGQNEEALTVAQAVLAKKPDDAEFNAVMGEILCARDDFPGAERYLKKSTEKSVNPKPELVSRVHALLGKVYAHTNRTQQAIAELKLALASDKDGSLHYQIARLYLKLGDRDSAMRAFEVSKRLEREGLVYATVGMEQGRGDSGSP